MKRQKKGKGGKGKRQEGLVGNGTEPWQMALGSLRDCAWVRSGPALGYDQILGGTPDVFKIHIFSVSKMI